MLKDIGNENFNLELLIVRENKNLLPFTRNNMNKKLKSFKKNHCGYTIPGLSLAPEVIGDERGQVGLGWFRLG